MAVPPICLCRPLPMDHVFRYLRRHRRRCLLLLALSSSGFAAYKICRLPAIAGSRRRLARLLGSLAAVADAAASSAETVSLVASEVNCFLRSDSDEIPTSLRQISKLARSQDASGSLARISEALTVGIVRGFRSSSNSKESEHQTRGFSDCVIEKLFSAEGSGLAAAVAGSFAKGLVIGFYSKGPEANGSLSEWDWVQLICDDRSREMIGDCIQQLVSTAVTVYLEKTMDMNLFNDLFAGLTNPNYERPMKDMLVSVCNEAVETLVTTSHRVLTSSNSNSSSNFSENRLVHELGKVEDLTAAEHGTSTRNKKDGGGWLDGMKSTLDVPSNRRFILDVTGRITFKTVRLFVEYALLHLYYSVKRGIDAVRQEMVECGFQVVRFFTAKSRVIITICLSLCMHIFTLTGTRFLTPA